MQNQRDLLLHTYNGSVTTCSSACFTSNWLLQQYSSWLSWQIAEQPAASAERFCSNYLRSSLEWSCDSTIKDKLHWLRICEHIIFKWCWVTCRTLHNPSCSEYISALVRRSSLLDRRLQLQPGSRVKLHVPPPSKMAKFCDLGLTPFLLRYTNRLSNNKKIIITIILLLLLLLLLFN